MKKRFKPIIAYSLIGLLACGLLSGCKETDVLKEIIYGDDTQIVDKTQSQVDNDETNTEEDEDLFAVTDSNDSDQEQSQKIDEDDDSKDESDDPAATRQSDPEKETTGELGDETPDETTETTTEENTKKNGGSNTENTEKTTSKEEDTSKKTGKSDETESESESETTTGKGSGSESELESQPESSPNEGSGGGESTEGSGGGETTDGSGGGGGAGDTETPSYTSAKSDPDNDRKTIDDNGHKNVSVPSNANIVVAPGEAAIMVEMLGENNTGHDILFGTSESVLNNDIAKTVFTDLTLPNDEYPNGTKVEQLWNGDGSSEITETGWNLIQQNAANIDVVFYIDGQDSFSKDQLDWMSDNDVAVVCLYKMNTPDNLKNNAELIGKIIGNHKTTSVSKEGINSTSTAKEGMAKKYCDWVNNVIAQFSNTHFADFKKSIFLESGGTDESAVNNKQGQYTVLADYWDDIAHITLNYNGSTKDIGQGAAAATAGYYTSPVNYFMQIAGVVNTAAAQVDFWPTFKDKNKIWYLNQYTFNTQGYISISGTYGEYSPGYGGAKSEGEEKSGPYLSEIGTDKVYSSVTANLGTDNFQKIIAASSEVANGLSTSKTFTQNGIPELESSSTIKDQYDQSDIVINPCGAGNWIKGSVETPLESFWIADTFDTARVDTSCHDATYSFYNTFYAHADNGGSAMSDADFDNLYYNYITTAATYN